MAFGIQIDTSELAAMCEAADIALQIGATSCIIEGIDDAVVFNRATHEYIDRTGELTNSVHREGLSLVASAEHASWVEEGTKAHPIDPVNARVLHWVDGGAHHFAHHVDHPGGKPYPFMQPAAEYAADVASEKIEKQLVPQLQALFLK